MSQFFEQDSENNFQNSDLEQFSTNQSDFVCIEDFCGTDSQGFPTQYWADWSKESEIVFFGGDWSIVPSLQAKTRPNDSDLHRWANYHLAMI